MARVIRYIDPETETGKFMPQGELLEPQRSEATLAVASHVTELIGQGIVMSGGELLVEFEDGLQVSAPYMFYQSSNSESTSE